MTVVTSGSPHFPEVVGAFPPSSPASMDAAVETVQSCKEAWLAVGIRERIAILDELIKNVAAISQRWVTACLKAKAIAVDEPAAGEEWTSGPYILLRNLCLLRQSLADIDRYGRPQIPGPVTTQPDGQVVAQVFPKNWVDRLFYTGITAEIWMKPGLSMAELSQTQALAYQPPAHQAEKPQGKVALVLGAGNVSCIGPTDFLYKFFVENQVVVYKTHPVNAYLKPLVEESFRPLIDRGFLRVVHGGGAEGAYLCRHPGIDEIHLTGSDKTFEAIIFGPGPAGEKRKANRKPLLAKRVTGELGNVSPVIVVPGPWRSADLTYHAENLVSMLTNNAGFNCLATRVIIQHSAWPERVELLDRIRKLLAQIPPRKAYYPGTKNRCQAFVLAHPEAEQFGEPTDSQLPWTLIAGVDSENKDDICFTTEAFCSIFAEMPLEAANTPDYIDRAVQFANEKMWGTLNATLIVHPASLKDPQVAAAVKRAIARLRYGTVAVNHWAAVGYGLAVTTWGAFPGHDIYNIQSGVGVVHNTLMFSDFQKSVVRAPFRARPTPPWFVTHKLAHDVGRKLTGFEASPSIWKIPSLFWSALRG